MFGEQTFAQLRTGLTLHRLPGTVSLAKLGHQTHERLKTALVNMIQQKKRIFRVRSLVKGQNDTLSQVRINVINSMYVMCIVVKMM